MAIDILLDRYRPLKIHDAITAASASPTTVADVQFSSKQYSRLRVLCDYNTVTACNLRLWVWDPVNLHWYRMGDSDDLDALVPGDGDEGRDYFLGRGAHVHVQVQALTGTAITVYVAGIDPGAESV